MSPATSTTASHMSRVELTPSQTRSSTVELMDGFYNAHVVNGLPLDAALQAAQIAAIARGGSPREWAPFVLIGSSDVVLREAKGVPTWLLLIGIAIACGVLAGVLRRRAART